MSKVIAKKQYVGIVKMFNALAGTRQLWELWEDAMIMFATMLSNAVDKRYYDKREEMFKNVVSKYNAQEVQTFLKIFAEIVNHRPFALEAVFPAKVVLASALDAEIEKIFRQGGRIRDG
jgi:hypothetical protein